MKKIFLICLLFIGVSSSAQFGRRYISFLHDAQSLASGQIVTDRYASLAGLNSTQKSIVKNYVYSLDTARIYNKILGEWLPIDTSIFKWNLVDPENWSSAFYLTYLGARPSAVSEGIQFNGGYVETGIDFTTVTDYPLGGAGFFSPVAIASGFYSTGDNTMTLLHHDGGKIWIFTVSGSSGVSANYTGGMIDMQRENLDSTHSYVDGTVFTSEGNAVSTSITQNTLKANYYSGAAVGATNKKSIMFVHLAFTADEEHTFYILTRQLLIDLGLL